MVLGDVDTLDSRRILDINFDTGDDDGLTILVLPKVCLRLLVLCAEAEELCSCRTGSSAISGSPHGGTRMGGGRPRSMDAASVGDLEPQSFCDVFNSYCMQ